MTTARLWCCGEALIDMLPEPLPGGSIAYRPSPGGAVFNTALALGRLGVPVGLVTGLSTDLFGDCLREVLAGSQVDCRHAVVSDRPTTLAFVRLDAGEASYRFYDEASAGRMLREQDMPAVPDDVTALFFGGISLACEPGAEAYAALAEAAADRLIMIDPNIRPGFIDEPSRYRARLARLFAIADVIKVSDQDLDWLAPSGSSPAAPVRALMAQGVKLVLVTRGADGVDVYLRNGPCFHVPASRVPVVDTVGAGDAFNAGFLAWLSRSGRLHKAFLSEPDTAGLQAAVAHGNRVAGLTVGRSGANPPWARDLLP